MNVKALNISYRLSGHTDRANYYNGLNALVSKKSVTDEKRSVTRYLIQKMIYSVGQFNAVTTLTVFSAASVFDTPQKLFNIQTPKGL